MRVLSWDVGLRTLSYCLLEATWVQDRLVFAIHEWDSIDVQSETGSSSNDVVTLTGAANTRKRKKMDTVSIEDGAKMVADAIHRRAHLFVTADVITIEQQPAGGHNRHSNVRMKVISHAIHMYFYSRGLVLPDVAAPDVTFVSAASKLKDMKKDLEGEETEGKTVSQLYSRNKKYAVRKTGELLVTVQPEQHMTKTLFQSASSSKKDDLADSFLLAYYYLLKHVKPPPAPKGRSRTAPTAPACVPAVQVNAECLHSSS